MVGERIRGADGMLEGRWVGGCASGRVSGPEGMFRGERAARI
jgi:hypothetical protein